MNITLADCLCVHISLFNVYVFGSVCVCLAVRVIYNQYKTNFPMSFSYHFPLQNISMLAIYLASIFLILISYFKINLTNAVLWTYTKC